MVAVPSKSDSIPGEERSNKVRLEESVTEERPLDSLPGHEKPVQATRQTQQVYRRK